MAKEEIDQLCLPPSFCSGEKASCTHSYLERIRSRAAEGRGGNQKERCIDCLSSSGLSCLQHGNWEDESLSGRPFHWAEEPAREVAEGSQQRYRDRQRKRQQSKLTCGALEATIWEQLAEREDSHQKELSERVESGELQEGALRPGKKIQGEL